MIFFDTRESLVCLAIELPSFHLPSCMSDCFSNPSPSCFPFLERKYALQILTQFMLNFFYAQVFWLSASQEANQSGATTF